MTADEQLKKDTLWEIHLTDKRIACLERRVTIGMDAMKEIVSLWGRGALTAQDGSFAEIKNDLAVRILNAQPDIAELTTALHDLTEARSNRVKLKGSFDRM